MKAKAFFVFLIMIFLVFSFGCTFPGGGKEKEKKGNSPQVGTGPLNGTILVNGKEGTNLNLISEQSAEVAFKFRNTGTTKVSDVDGILVGCLDPISSEAHEDSIPPGAQAFFSWSVKAPPLSTGEKIKCPEVIRICYKTNLTGYAQVVFIPEDWKEEYQAPGQGYTSDVMSLNFQLGVVRVLKDTNNTFTGKLIITNVGPGWIDYRNYSELKRNGEAALGLNLLKRIKVNISTPDSKLKIVKFFDLDKNNKEVDLSVNEVESTQKYIFKLIQGKELIIPIEFEISKDDAKFYQDGVHVETLQVEIEHGYCIDVGSIDVTMSGR